MWMKLVDNQSLEDKLCCLLQLILFRCKWEVICNVGLRGCAAVPVEPFFLWTQRDWAESATHAHILLGLVGMSKSVLGLWYRSRVGVTWKETRSNWYPRKRNQRDWALIQCLGHTGHEMVNRLASHPGTDRDWCPSHVPAFDLCHNLGEYPRSWRKAKRQCPELVYGNLCGCVCGNRYPQDRWKWPRRLEGEIAECFPPSLSIVKWGISRKRWL